MAHHRLRILVLSFIKVRERECTLETPVKGNASKANENEMQNGVLGSE